MDELGSTVLMMMFAFVGFESSTIVSGESTDPRGALPVALIQTTLAIGVVYFLVVLAYVAVLPQLEGEAPTLVAMGAFLFGPVGAILVTLAAVFSIAGNLGAILLAVPRLTFALAQQQLLPRWFRHVHERHATPSNSILFLGAISLVLALTGSFVQLAIASALTRLITYVLCITALPVIRRRASASVRAAALALPGGYAIPVVALLISVWIALQSGPSEWLLTGGLFGVGLLLYGLAHLGRGAPGGPDPTDR
jgi:amino acid transporter